MATERWTITDPAKPGEQWEPEGTPSALADLVTRKQAAGFWSADIAIDRQNISQDQRARLVRTEILRRVPVHQQLEAIMDFLSRRKLQGDQLTAELNEALGHIAAARAANPQEPQTGHAMPPERIP